VSGTQRRFCRVGSLLAQHWEGESSAVVRRCDAGTTHLISAQALELLHLLQPDGPGLALREIARAGGLEGELDHALLDGMQGIIESLMQAGLVLESPDDAAGSRPAH
jgi:hypothetical protein